MCLQHSHHKKKKEVKKVMRVETNTKEIPSTLSGVIYQGLCPLVAKQNDFLVL